MADEKVKVSSLVTVAPKTTDKVLITTTDDSGQLQTRNALVSDIRNLAASLEDSEDKAINVKIANKIVKKVTDLAGEVDTSFETVNQNFTNVNNAISKNRDNITTANENMTAHEEDTDLHVTAEKQQKWDGYDQSIKDVKEIADNNTTQLNTITQKFNGFKKQMISTEHKTYYVSTNGNDTTGDGSIEKPFRTIQKVQDLIPTILHHIYTISVLDGTYDGFTIFSHFGSGQIVIKSNSGNRDNVSISFANFNFCYNLVLLEGVTINTTTQIKISSYGCQRLEIKNCKLDSSSSYDGVIVEYTNCYLHDTLISNQETAIKSIVAGFILAQGCSGSGNGTALSAIYGGVIAKDNNTITATTQENSGLGGL
ncbi:hypothetical protein [Clostridium neonatale]|uniref:hypothetical protein n=1 Tax=Clostridium neonatale TaxID=137838 RepID=UPI00291BD34C|nr:hypothetical protein CNEO3_1080007 [Clostridium neonatale]CAI3548634.1 hypothetical protein CNEO3_1010007 [Clostridium neonatale]CAI3551302.1 hypothetical protein CNEO3_1070007 [Clostridium neonatale]CAI3680028.1 hypothetical protein CNEO3_920013 [Clostridium neonatale]CAI3714836.1 hypothetical protein CNEO3_960007 [Clostridium neonatale]